MYGKRASLTAVIYPLRNCYYWVRDLNKSITARALAFLHWYLIFFIYRLFVDVIKMEVLMMTNICRGQSVGRPIHFHGLG